MMYFSRFCCAFILLHSVVICRCLVHINAVILCGKFRWLLITFPVLLCSIMLIAVAHPSQYLMFYYFGCYCAHILLYNVVLFLFLLRANLVILWCIILVVIAHISGHYVVFSRFCCAFILLNLVGCFRSLVHINAVILCGKFLSAIMN